MTLAGAFDPTSFKGMEQAGWHANAATYDDLLGTVTRHAIPALLDAAKVGAGSTVLELCCGPGYGAAAAHARGARATGIDFAPAMIEAARRNFPGIDYRDGDAEAIAFADGTFDAVICSFGVNHLPHPDDALREAHRVLRPGGRIAFSMWCVPGKSKFHGLVMEAIRTHGRLDVPLPPAPPPFRFSDPAACEQALQAAGFAEATVTEVPLAFHADDPARVLDLAYSAVRMAMTIRLQSADVQRRIEQAILGAAEGSRQDGRIVVPMPALIASGRRNGARAR